MEGAFRSLAVLWLCVIETFTGSMVMHIALSFTVAVLWVSAIVLGWRPVAAGTDYQLNWLSNTCTAAGPEQSSAISQW